MNATAPQAPTALRCCVIDDEPLAARLIASYVERTPGLELVGTFFSASEAIKPIMAGEVDLLFLDIEMPQLGGMELARLVPPSCRIIFTTAYDRYAVQGFKVNAVDYLLKPVSYEEFLAAVARAVKTMVPEPSATEAAKREFLIVKSEYKLVQIRIADISVIEGLKDYIKIHLDGVAKPILTLMAMKAVEQALPAGNFIRVHRSYIVNTSKISIIDRNHVTVGPHTVPVSETYRQALSDYIASHNPEE